MDKGVRRAAIGLRATAWAGVALCAGAPLVAGGCGGGIDPARGYSMDAAVDVVPEFEADTTDAAPSDAQDARASGPDAQGPEAGARGTIVLFGGADANTLTTEIALGDTWLWDGNVWTPWTPAAGAAVPPARSYHGMSTLNGSVVLLGGEDGKGNLLSDTWTWDGSAWASRTVNPPPPAVDTFAMAALNDRVVRFGGCCQAGLVSAETWTWDGTGWGLVPPPTSPPARRDHAMATLGGRVVVFAGGDLQSSATMDDQWAWDGVTWTAQTGAVRPGPRRAHSMATLGSKVVLFGGEYCGPPTGPIVCTLLNDTWEWDGTTWTQAMPAASPPARHYAAMATLGDKLVLFGGTGAAFFNDTWEWDGTTWTERHPAMAPPSRYGHAMSSR